MSAFASSLALAQNIFQQAEIKINQYLAKIAASEQNTDILTPASLSDAIARELGIKPADCLHSVLLYIKHRPELEVRNGRMPGIYLVSATSEKTLMSPKECALKHYDAVKTTAQPVIIEEFKKIDEAAQTRGVNNLLGLKLNFQTLAQIIADKIGIKQYAAYHCLKEYISKERQEDLVIELGRYGGLRRIKV